jgi:outer membrane protein TolC
LNPSVLRCCAALAAVLLAGCAPLPPAQPSGDDLSRMLEQDRQAVTRNVPPLPARLSLDEAIARALKFNLDRRVRLLEEAVALQQYEAGRFDSLPRLLASAGYTARDRDRIANSIDSVTGQPSLANPSISQAREHTLVQLDLSWSLLDYGLARYSAQQAGDRMLAAAQRRRKATHLLVQDVRQAYWRAASAQRLAGDVRAALQLAETAMGDASKAEAERLRAPLDAMRYQRQLVENMRLLKSIEQELLPARFELAALINAPVMQQVELVSDELGRSDPLAASAEAMEEQALAQNADLREHVHLRRIAQAEVRKALARAYPNLSVNVGPRHDTDRFLTNSDWSEAGVQVSFNLLNLLVLPAQRRAAEGAVAVADQRRLAAHVAVVTQVHVAREQLAGARKQFRRADALWQLDGKIMQQLLRREQAEAGSKLERVAAQTTAIVSLLRRYQALAQVHAATSRLQATLGVDPLPESSDELSLEQIREQVRQRLLDS